MYTFQVIVGTRGLHFAFVCGRLKDPSQLCNVYRPTDAPALGVLPQLAALALRRVERVTAAAVAVLAAVALLPRLHDAVAAGRGRD